jgi:hypothetical protein
MVIDMQATSTDYVVQGTAVFFPAVNCRATPERCDCAQFGSCNHRIIASRVLNAPTSSHWTDDQLQALASYLNSEDIDILDGVMRFLGFPRAGAKASLSSVLDAESYSRLDDLTMRCDRCRRWKDNDYFSIDVYGVCLDCVI